MSTPQYKAWVINQKRLAILYWKQNFDKQKTSYRTFMANAHSHRFLFIERNSVINLEIDDSIPDFEQPYDKRTHHDSSLSCLFGKCERKNYSGYFNEDLVCSVPHKKMIELRLSEHYCLVCGKSETSPTHQFIGIFDDKEIYMCFNPECMIYFQEKIYDTCLVKKRDIIEPVSSEKLADDFLNKLLTDDKKKPPVDYSPCFFGDCKNKSYSDKFPFSCSFSHKKGLKHHLNFHCCIVCGSRKASTKYKFVDILNRKRIYVCCNPQCLQIIEEKVSNSSHVRPFHE